MRSSISFNIIAFTSPRSKMISFGGLDMGQPNERMNKTYFLSHLNNVFEMLYEFLV